MTFQKGDLVRLKSGGPLMTVEIFAEGLVDCIWANGSKVERQFFEPSTLEKATKLTVGVSSVPSMKNAWGNARNK